MNQDTAQVIHNESKHRFEAEGEGRAARLDYTVSPTTVVFTHTEVPKDLKGRGVAAALAKAGLAYARDTGRRVVPQCLFVSTYIERHPEYQDLVQTDSAQA
jgi:predicted GNAT family acetyltransferase